MPARDPIAGTVAVAGTADPGEVVADYLRRLDRTLHGPARAKADLLAEARDSLHDAATAYRRDGLTARQAESRAVAEFGTVAELAPAYQSELAAGAARALVLRTALAFIGVAGASTLMWWRAPWTATEPPGAYLLLATWVDRLGYGLVAAALVTYGWLARTARRARPLPPGAARLVGAGTTLVLALTALGGALVYGWSVRLWQAASTWPPMIAGGLAIALMYGWLGRTALDCLRSGRPGSPPAPSGTGRLRQAYGVVRRRGTGRPSS